jgi:hypothetical protein
MTNRKESNSVGLINGTNQSSITDAPFVNINSVTDGINTAPLVENTSSESQFFYVSGTARPYETLFVYLNDDRVAVIRADQAGNWTTLVYTGNQSYGETNFTVTVPATNATDSFQLTLIEAPAETRPSVEEVYNDDGNWWEWINSGASTTDANPLVRGTAPAGSVVEIKVNGDTVGSVIADENNNWSWNPPLEAGSNIITVISNGEESEPYQIIYQAAPVIVVPEEPSLAITQITDPSNGNPIEAGGSANYPQVMLSGTGPRDQWLQIWSGDQFVATVYSNNNGDWNEYIQLPEGENALTVRAGNAQSDIVLINIPVTLPEIAPPEIFQGWADENGYGPIYNGDSTQDSTPTLEGRAANGARVEIWLNDRYITTVDAGRNGYWNYTPTLNEGMNQIHVVSQGVSSAVFEINYVPIVVPVDQELAITQITDTWTGGLIEAGGASSSQQVELTGTGPRNQRVEIWSGDRFITTVYTDHNGNWNQYLSLPEGENTLIVRSGRDQSDAVMISTPVTPPPTPEIYQGWADENGYGPIYNGDSTQDSTPTLEGRAANGARVEIWLNDRYITTVDAGRNGYWNYTPTLNEGMNQIHVVSQGVSSAVFEINYVPIVVPVDQELAITQITDTWTGGLIEAGGASSSQQVELTGTGPRNQRVEIWSGDRFITTVYTDHNGNWNQYLSLPEGENTLIVRSGRDQSDAVMISTPVTPPPTPEIYQGWADENGYGPIYNGDSTQDSTPTLEGRAANGSRVEIWLNDRYITTVDAGRNGYWNYTPTLNEGMNQIHVVSQGVSSAVFEINYAPVITPIEPELTIEFIDRSWDGNSNTTQDRISSFTGKAPAGSVITLYVNGQPVTTIEVDRGGEWHYSTALFDGANILNVASGTDVSAAITVTVSGSPAPVISWAFDDEGMQSHVYHNGATDDATPQLKGLAAPYSLIQVYVGTQHVGSTEADINGNWDFTPTIHVGSNDIHVVENGVASEIFTITLMIAPTITGLYADGDLIEHGGSSEANNYTLKGTAQPFAVVELYQSGSNNPLRITADEYGNWSHTVSATLGDNTYWAFSGNQYSEGYSFTYHWLPEQSAASDTGTADISHYVPYISTVEDSVGSMQWLRSGSWTDDTQPEIYGTYARPHSVVSIVDGNNNLIGTATADRNGDWTFTPAEPLAPGQYDFYAQNESGISGNPFTLNVNDPDPAPTMVAWDDAGDYQGIRKSGDFVDDSTPTFHGSGKPNTLISLVDQDNQLLATTTSNWSGAWTIEIEQPLQTGTHTFVAVEQDGQSSEPLVLNILSSDGAAWPEITALLADGDAMLFAAQATNIEEHVELTISEADMTQSNLNGGVITDFAGQNGRWSEQLEEQQNLNNL